MRKANVGLMGMNLGITNSIINGSNCSGITNTAALDGLADEYHEYLKQESGWGDACMDFGVQNNHRRRFTQPVYRCPKDTRKKRKAHRAAVKLQRRLKKIRK